MTPQIEAFEQPLELLRGELVCYCLAIAQPNDFLRFKALKPQAEIIPVPVQHHDLVALAIDEDVQGLAEWIAAELLLNKYREPID